VPGGFSKGGTARVTTSALRRGAYVLNAADEWKGPDVILIASGSEVGLIVAAKPISTSARSPNSRERSSAASPAGFIAIFCRLAGALAPKAIKKSFWLGALGLLACVAFALDAGALLVLLGGGVASVLASRLANKKDAAHSLAPSILGGLAVGGASVLAPVSLVTLFLTFLKVGAVVFGSGYVLLAFLQADMVDRLHWLTEAQILDAVAVGQVTPGPVFTTATFIGYVIARGWGAVLATVGIFLPGFVLVALTRPLVVRVRRSPIAGAFLDGVNVSALALMAVVTVRLARSALVDGPTILLAVGGAGALSRFKVNTTWLVAGGALIGAALKAGL